MPYELGQNNAAPSRLWEEASMEIMPYLSELGSKGLQEQWEKTER